MRRKVAVMVVVSLALLAMSALAQTKPVNVGRVIGTFPKPGMAKQYEEARKRHMDWHRKQNDSWSWNVWQVETGEHAGAYVITSFGHDWKDLDAWEQKYGEGDDADVAATMGPYVAGDTASVWMFLPDISRPSDSKEPSKMGEIVHFLLKPECEADFFAAMHKVHEAIGKTNWPVQYSMFTLVNGGEQPHVALVLPRNAWADMAEPDPSFPAMLEKALGRHEAESVMHDLDKSLRREWSEMLRYRADLSYHPAAR